MKSLEYLTLSEEFKIEEVAKGVYNIDHKQSDLCATINNKEVKYYISGIYDSGMDYKEIDEFDFYKLKRICWLINEGQNN